MSCNCTTLITNWYDLQNTDPKNPFDLIAYADLDGTPGIFERSQDFLNPGGTWTASPISVLDGGLCEAWETDNQQFVGDALMWSQQHQVTNAATDIPTALQKIMYMRGGYSWKMKIPLDFSVDLDSIQLSFLENAGTRGDAQGTIPVIRFQKTGPLSSGQHILHVTLKTFGQVSMGIKADATISGDQSLMELDWIIV